MNKHKSKLFLGLAFLGGYAWASAPSFQLFINGTASNIQVIEAKEEMLVPLNFPVTGEEQEWTVSLQREDNQRRVQVKMKAIQRKPRGDTECYWCTSSGKCAQDYPVGSGKNYSGASEYFCNGTGKCHHCAGSGKL